MLLFIVLVTATFVAHAQTGGLSEKITLNLRQTNAKQLIEETDRQSKYAFMFEPGSLANIRIDHIEVKAITLSEWISLLQKKYGLVFSIAGENISVNAGPIPATKKTTGKVSGVILDEEDGQPVTGATIQAGAKTVVTDLDGRFTLTLPNGSYEATVSATGYGKKVLTDIEVKDEQTLTLSISLQRQKGQLAGVVVRASARKESVASLLQRQKNSASISDGISAEQIGRTPDKNVGEVLKRISGVSTLENKYVVVRGLGERYNQAIMNGQVMPSTEINRKNFSFDIIPSGLVENIVVTKTITPDRSAEFGGGNVEVNTISIPNNNFFQVNAGASYNSNTTGKDFVSLKLEGREYLATASSQRKFLGSMDWKSREDMIAAYNASDKNKLPVTNNWGLTKMAAPLSQNYQVSGGRVFNKENGRQFGITGALTYRNTFNTLEVKSGRDGFEPLTNTNGQKYGYTGTRYSFMTNIGGLLAAGFRGQRSKISVQGLVLRTLDQQMQTGSGSHAGYGGTPLGYYDITMQTTMAQVHLNGEHAVGKKGAQFKWMGSYIFLDRLRPDNHQMISTFGRVDISAPEDYNISSSNSSVGAGALRWWGRARENNVNWDASISVPFNFIGGKHTFKGGYAGWRKDRSFFVMNGVQNFSNKIYSPSLMTAFSPENDATYAVNQFGDDFNRTADLHAAYLMLDDKLGKRWRIVWGLRGEYFNMNAANANLDHQMALINDTRNPSDQFDFSELKNREPNLRFFPSANLTFSLNKTMNLRLAYAKSIIRPDLRELSYFKEYDFELGGEYQASLVRSSVLDHFDFRYEWYPAPGEVMSVSLFYKNIDYPMEIYQVSDNRLFQLKNNRNAKNYGIEVEVRKSLAFTGVPVIRNLTLYGNFTRLFAEVTPMFSNFNKLDPNNPLRILPEYITDSVERRPQAGASNINVNAALYYDTKPISVSLNYNYVTNRTFRPEILYAKSLFERPLESLDAQVALHLLKNKLDVKLNITNLLNSYSLVYSNQELDMELLTGKRQPSAKDLMYIKGKSIVNWESRPGQTYSASISYKF